MVGSANSIPSGYNCVANWAAWLHNLTLKMRVMSHTIKMPPRWIKELLFTLFGVVSLLLCTQTNASEQAQIRVAVASNFASAAEDLAAEFVALGNIKPILLFGSTGKHTAQIAHGLKVDLLLAADVTRPEWLEQQGLVVANTRVDYAIGRLVYWSPKPLAKGRALDQSQVLNQLVDEHNIAIANPKLAPYGLAAEQTIERFRALTPNRGLNDFKPAMAENIAQAFQFIRSGNAPAGFVARSQTMRLPAKQLWMVPADFHAPIRQQMALLSPSQQAQKFYNFIRSPQGVAIILRHGYDVAQ